VSVGISHNNECSLSIYRTVCVGAMEDDNDGFAMGPEHWMACSYYQETPAAAEHDRKQKKERRDFPRLITWVNYRSQVTYVQGIRFTLDPVRSSCRCLEEVHEDCVETVHKISYWMLCYHLGLDPDFPIIDMTTGVELDIEYPWMNIEYGAMNDEEDRWAQSDFDNNRDRWAYWRYMDALACFPIHVCSDHKHTLMGQPLAPYNPMMHVDWGSPQDMHVDRKQDTPPSGATDAGEDNKAEEDEDPGHDCADGSDENGPDPAKQHPTEVSHDSKAGDQDTGGEEESDDDDGCASKGADDTEVEWADDEFEVMGHTEAYTYLLMGKIPSRFSSKEAYGKRKSWKQNVRRRFKLLHIVGFEDERFTHIHTTSHTYTHTHIHTYSNSHSCTQCHAYRCMFYTFDLLCAFLGCSTCVNPKTTRNDPLFNPRLQRSDRRCTIRAGSCAMPRHWPWWPRITQPTTMATTRQRRAWMNSTSFTI
jgi:hypothetical protein